MPRASSSVRSVNINGKQLLIAILIVCIIITIPLAYSYFKNPERTSIRQTLEETIDTLRGEKSEEEIESQYVTLPIINSEIDVSILQKNPQLLMYAGIVFFAVSFIIGITLYRSTKS